MFIYVFGRCVALLIAAAAATLLLLLLLILLLLLLLLQWAAKLLRFDAGCISSFAAKGCY